MNQTSQVIPEGQFRVEWPKQKDKRWVIEIVPVFNKRTELSARIR
jgi:hypothetical protein